MLLQQVCQFRAQGNGICDAGHQHWLKWMWYERHQDKLLTLSPCHLFRHLAARTLWIVGDSQMQARMPTCR